MKRLRTGLPALAIGLIVLASASPAVALVRPVDVIVHFGGLGQGRVTSDPAGMDCTSDCTVQFEWLQNVALTAEALNGGTFAGWQDGPCDGSMNPTCSFQVPATHAEMTALFDSIAPPVSQPPSTPVVTQPALTPPALVTPKPSPTPVRTTAPSDAPPSAEPTAEGVASAPPTDAPTSAPSPTPAPTIVGLDDGGQETAAAGGVPLPIVIVLILILGAVVGGGVYWFTKRRQAGTP